MSYHGFKQSKKKPITPGKCKFCNDETLFWDNTEARGVLIESYGLPHSCQARIDIGEAKRKEYAEYKEKINVIPHNSICCKCSGNGYMNVNAYCEECSGVGRFTKAVKRNLLARKRNELWPNMNS